METILGLFLRDYLSDNARLEHQDEDVRIILRWMGGEWHQSSGML
jgi:hypothetical protein